MAKMKSSIIKFLILIATLVGIFFHLSCATEDSGTTVPGGYTDTTTTGGTGGSTDGSDGSMSNPYVVSTEPVSGSPVTYSDVTSTDYYSTYWNSYLTFIKIPASPNQSYIVTLTGLSTDIDLYVTNSSTYYSFDDYSSQSGIVDEDCQIEITGNYIYVMLDSANSGEAFTLTASVAPQGTSVMNPFILTVPDAATPATYTEPNITGTIYFKVPLTPGLREGYEVSLSGIDGTLYFSAAVNSDFATGNKCGTGGTAGGNPKCTLILPSPDITVIRNVLLFCLHRI
jgi:hypothetical protein